MACMFGSNRGLKGSRKRKSRCHSTMLLLSIVAIMGCVPLMTAPFVHSYPLPPQSSGGKHVIEPRDGDDSINQSAALRIQGEQQQHQNGGEDEEAGEGGSSMGRLRGGVVSEEGFSYEEKDKEQQHYQQGHEKEHLLELKEEESISAAKRTEQDERRGEDISMTKRGLQVARPSSSTTNVPEGVHYTGQGGKLVDGRDRCFIDNQGFHRCYPTVFFIGTSKCATTSLARWLDNHPATHWVANPRRPNQIEQTGVKEAHVFDDPPKGSPSTEQGLLHDKLFITSPKVHADRLVIDYTPHYLAAAETPYRIFDMYGGASSGVKFIVTLREPASRSISSWEFKNEFNPKKGRQEESRSLGKTVQEGVTRAGKLDACLSLAKDFGYSAKERDLDKCNPRKFLEIPLFVSHVGKSMYSLQLERWFNLFGKENFKIIFTDDMATDPIGVLKDVINFLGLDFTSDDLSEGLPDMKRWIKITGMAYNKTRSKKKDELDNQVTDDIQNELFEFFEPHNRALEELLGMKVPKAWNKS